MLMLFCIFAKQFSKFIFTFNISLYDVDKQISFGFFILLYDTLIFNASIIFFFEWYPLLLILLLHTNDVKKKNRYSCYFKDINIKFQRHEIFSKIHSFLKKRKKKNKNIQRKMEDHFKDRSLSIARPLGKNNPCSNSSLLWKRAIYIFKPRNDTKLARRRSHSARDPDFRVVG